MKKPVIAILALCLPLFAFAEDSPKEVTPEHRAENPEVASEAKSVEAKRTELLHGAEKVIEGAKAYVESRQAETSEIDVSKPVLTLDANACAEMAVRQNPQALIAQDEVDAVEAKIGQVMAQWRPQISAKMGVQHVEYNSKEYNPFLKVMGLGGSSSGGSSLGGSSSGLGGLGGGLGGSTPGQLAARVAAGVLINQGMKQLTKGIADDLTPGTTFVSESVTLKQVFYAGGQISAAVKASQYLAQSQEWQRLATLDALEYQAKQAYYDCVLADSLVVVAEESVVTFKRHLSDAQQMFDVGMISGFEVLRAKTELGSRSSGLVAAKNAALLARANLRRILSAPQDQPLQLQGELSWIPVSDSMEDHVRFAYEHRPEVLALERGLAAADQDTRRVKGQYKPQVAGQIDYTNTDNAGAAVQDGWKFMVGAEIDIYAGGRRKHEVVESKANKSKLEHQLEDIKHLIELDVRQTRIQVDNAISQIQSEQGNVELGKEGLRLAELRFQEGVGTQAETLDADLALSSAESKLAQALHDYSVAHAALDKALGTGQMRAKAAAAETTEATPKP